MAIHVSIIRNDFYPKIRESIFKRFAKKNIGLNSFRYQELRDKDYKLCENDRVFLYTRTINREILYFEVHFNTEEQKIIDIFLIK